MKCNNCKAEMEEQKEFVLEFPMETPIIGKYWKKYYLCSFDCVRALTTIPKRKKVKQEVTNDGPN